jgi:hypothetical protein
MFTFYCVEEPTVLENYEDAHGSHAALISSSSSSSLSLEGWWRVDVLLRVFLL